MSLANVNIRPIRPQQHRLTWPLTPDQVENIDTMLETLFKATRTLQTGVNQVGNKATNALALAAGMIGEMDSGGNDSAVVLSQPGATGPQGLIGSMGPGLIGDTDGNEDAMISSPGPAGAQGTTGAQGPIGAFMDAPPEGQDDPFILSNPAAGVPYSEGTWTPTDGSGASLAFTSTYTAQWRRIGNLVFATFDVTYPATASGLAAVITGLPFTPAAAQFPVTIGYCTFATGFLAFTQAATKSVLFFNLGGATQITNANFSGVIVRGSAAYFV